MRVLLVDHEDSYTHNLAHLIAACIGEWPTIAQHNDPLLLTLAAQADSIVLSPGPGSPLHARDAGQSLALIQHTNKPILGVCFGHQLLAYAYGATITPARTPTHGYTSPITHEGEGLFAGLPQPLTAMRYHSLAVTELPPALRALAHTEDGEIMALAHVTKLHFGVQFHPESIGTPHGKQLLENFFARAHIALATHSSPESRTLTAAPAPTLVPHPWQDPHAAFAAHFLHQANAFLLSGTGRYAYAGCGERTEPSWQQLAREPRAPSDHALFAHLPFTAGVVGLLAYDTHPHRFIRPTTMLIFDRETQQAWRSGALPTGHTHERAVTDASSEESSGATVLTSQTSEAYARRIAQCQAAIRTGEAYELCLTRQIQGTTTLAPWQVFEALWAANPAPFSAFIACEEEVLVAASPELFLRVRERRAETSPIKGTRARGATPASDLALQSDLASHPKDRAENVMIVDVARHDLGGVCSKVEVSELCVVKTFATVHQLVSTVRGELRTGITAADAARALFPPASMTGAPKARAREWLARIEDAPRGFYAGAYGWFADSGECELAVTIRSLWFAQGAEASAPAPGKHHVTFGVGGAILLDSHAESEWNETQSKARASMRALGITK